ncbi:hypothetical protein HDE_01501 [Halotydeus destructor]|nr:hypothetical protein HDE_01501 [Halotydeus destructor]
MTTILTTGQHHASNLTKDSAMKTTETTTSAILETTTMVENDEDDDGQEEDYDMTTIDPNEPSAFDRVLDLLAQRNSDKRSSGGVVNVTAGVVYEDDPDDQDPRDKLLEVLRRHHYKRPIPYLPVKMEAMKVEPKMAASSVMGMVSKKQYDEMPEMCRMYIKMKE